MPENPRKLRVIDSPDPERPPTAPETPREKLHLGHKTITEVNRPQESTSRPITVHAILAENLRHTVPSERPMDLRKRRSRRARDYWLLLLPVGAVCGAVAYLFRDNPFILAAALAGGTVFALGLTWVMWQVMSDY